MINRYPEYERHARKTGYATNFMLLVYIVENNFILRNSLLIRFGAQTKPLPEFITNVL